MFLISRSLGRTQVCYGVEILEVLEVFCPLLISVFGHQLSTKFQPKKTLRLVL